MGLNLNKRLQVQKNGKCLKNIISKKDYRVRKCSLNDYNGYIKLQIWFECECKYEILGNCRFWEVSENLQIRKGIQKKCIKWQYSNYKYNIYMMVLWNVICEATS
jgi:hypothetical protein